MKISEKRAHIAAFAISALCAIVGLGVGIGLGSATVLNDAAHMLADSTGFLIVLVGFVLSEGKVTKKYTYGMNKLEALGTLLSVDLLWIVTGIVMYLSALRIIEIQNGNFTRLNGWPILGMGIASLLSNLIILLALSNVSDHGHGHSHGHDIAPEAVEVSDVATVAMKVTPGGERLFVTPKQSGQSWSSVQVQIFRTSHVEVLSFDRDGTDWISREIPDEPHEFRADLIVGNGQAVSFQMSEPKVKWSQSLRNSFAHVIGHLVQCSTVIVVGLVFILSDAPQVQFLDPAVAILSASISLGLTFSVTLSAVRILLDTAPNSVPVDKVLDGMLALPGVQSVHDLHLWRLKSGKHCLTAHVTMNSSQDQQRLLDSLHSTTSRLGVHHATFQLEKEVGNHHYDKHPCGINAVHPFNGDHDIEMS